MSFQILEEFSGEQKRQEILYVSGLGDNSCPPKFYALKTLACSICFYKYKFLQTIISQKALNGF